MIPTPRRARIPLVSGEMADAHVRLRNERNGAGRRSIGGWWYSGPSARILPVSSPLTMASAYSLKRPRDSPISSRNPSNSTRPEAPPEAQQDPPARHVVEHA